METSDRIPDGVTFAHAFSLRNGRRRLFEEQGFVQEASCETRTSMAREPRSSFLGRQRGARDRCVRSGRREGHPPKRLPRLGEPGKDAAPRGSKGLGLGGGGEGRGGLRPFRRRSNRRGRESLAILGPRLEAERRLAESPRSAEGMD